MPFPNFHAARVKSPDLFEKESFRTKNIKSGIDIIIGRLKGQTTTTTQAYRFNKDKFTSQEAKDWLKENEIKFISFEKAKEIEAFLHDVCLVSKRISSFQQSEILELIPEDILKKIKTNDNNPFFQMFSLCHEGISQPTILGEKEKSEPIFWSKKAIQSIKNILVNGVKLFVGHNEDNSIEKRESIGEIIHSFQKEMEGKLHHIIIAYHNNEQKEKAKKCDICSQEAIWNFFKSTGRLMADKIEKLTGVALGNSSREKPAFSGARRLGFVQAFEQEQQKVINNQHKGEFMPSETSSLSFEQWKKMKKDFHVHAWQLFTKEELESDREFGKYFDELRTLKEQNEELKQKTKKQDELIKIEKDKYGNELKGLQKQIYQSSAKKRLSKIIDENNLTDRIKVFVEKSYDIQKENLEDLSDEGLKNFADSQVKTYQNVVSVIDFKEPTPSGHGDDKEKDEKDEKDVTKKENNEYLKDDFNLDDD
jgi:hypothetical protein